MDKANEQIQGRGKFDGQDVIFGPLSKAPGGLANTKQLSDQVPSNDTVWVTNTKGTDMTNPLPLETAKYLVNRAGNKFRYATEDEIPFCPAQKVYPYDPEKKVQAQEHANVEISGNEVAELVKQGIDPLDGVMSYKDLRAVAKENNIRTNSKTKKALIDELRDKKLIN